MALAAALLALLAVLALRAVKVESDFGAFLPASATPEQGLLNEQLRHGLVSRMVLVALEGPEEKELAAASRALALRLERSPQFESVSNGAQAASPGVGGILLANRYVLSPGVGAGSFTVQGLRKALGERLDDLASPFSPARAVMTRDPTGELAAVVAAIAPESRPATRGGVWFDAQGRRAVLVAQTRAPGFDTRAQASAASFIREAAAQIAPGVQVTLSGPGIFAAESQRIIEGDARRLGALSLCAVLALLLYVYRRPGAVARIALPVMFGLLAGVLAVQALFGSVHAVTLGFGATLVGEAVDYPNYMMVLSQPGDAASNANLGRTLWLAVLTTVTSAIALALSSFPGLAELGVLTMVGIVVAGAVARWMLPWLAAGAMPAAHPLALPRDKGWLRSRTARAITALAVLGALAGLAAMHPAWRERDLASLSPIPATLRAADAKLRAELGAPDVSYVAAAQGASEDEALAAAEALGPALRRAREEGALRGFESPTALLPPLATQRARLAAIPAPQALRANLQAALAGSAFRPGAFDPFLAEAERARDAPPVTRATYAGTPLAARLDALVMRLEGAWLVLTPLVGVSDPTAVSAALAGLPHAKLVDLRQVSADMVQGYLRESMRQVALGVVLTVGLLLAALRSPRRAWRVFAPVAGALAVTCGLLAALGVKLSVFHLVALLLVLGIGLNYPLFLELESGQRERVRQALALCVATTAITFGILATSGTPVLRAIGATVALGSLVALLFSLAWAPGPGPREAG